MQTPMLMACKKSLNRSDKYLASQLLCQIGRRRKSFNAFLMYDMQKRTRMTIYTVCLLIVHCLKRSKARMTDMLVNVIY